MASGDQDFMDFLRSDSNSNNDSTEILIIINAIKAKVHAVSDLYRETLSAYNDIPEEDSIKKDMRKFLKDLITEAKQTFTQFDYALLPEDEDGEDNES